MTHRKRVRLDAAIRAVCPIHGTSGMPPTLRIDFDSAATPQQRADAEAVAAAFDWSDAAQAAWEASLHPEREELRNAAAQALADIDTYLAIASPNNAQVVAQVRRLSQYVRALIRRTVQID